MVSVFGYYENAQNYLNGRFIVDNSSRKLLSCLVLALSLGKSVSANFSCASVMHNICGWFSKCCCKRRNHMPDRQDILDGLDVPDRLDRRPLMSLTRGTEALTLLRWSDYYNDCEMCDEYEEIIKKNINGEGNFRFDNLKVIFESRRRRINIAYSKNIGGKIFFNDGTCSEFILNSNSAVFALFENDSYNSAENILNNNEVVINNVDSSDVFKSVIALWNSNLKGNCVPVKAENCRYDWKVSNEQGLTVKRNNACYAHPIHYRIIKLTVRNDEELNGSSKVVPKIFTSVFIVKLSN